MKRLSIAIVCAAFIATCCPGLVYGQSPLLLKPERALQVSFPTRESYQYQLFYSANLSDWAVAGSRVMGSGSNMSVAFPATNSALFYQVQETAPDTTRRIVGFADSSLDTASISSSGNQIKISGLRVLSADYNWNDYLVAKYGLDPVSQGFMPVKINVMTNVGVTCGASSPLFVKDSTNAIVLTDGTSKYFEWNSYSVTSTGQVFYANLATAQILSLVTKPAADDFRITISDPDGNTIDTYEVAAGVTYFHDGVRAFRAGRYSWKFESLTKTSFTLGFRFINANRTLVSPLQDGDVIWCSLGDYFNDYAKYRITLNAGDTLRLDPPGEGASLELYDSKGVAISTFSGSGQYICVAPKTDTYYLLYDHFNFYSHNYYAVVSITPANKPLNFRKANFVNSGATGSGGRAGGRR